uniref:Uncharacterized protein n=1 Tax=viral metagenome TaxID=1070528 RepID=A0A6C0B3Y0_9ZZZZ
MDKHLKSRLTDAKQEYTQVLIDFLMDPIYAGLRTIYNTARDTSKSKNLNTLKTFQMLLSKTPKWSDDKLNKEIIRIKETVNCDYLEDLITAVFVTHVKILISIKSKNKTDTLDLNVPKITYFIHKIYIQCARNFWRQPWLFHTGYNSLDLQRNLIKSEKLIKESILETIRKLLPLKEVLQQYLGNNFIDNDFSDYAHEDITSTISENTKTNIKKLLKHEFDNNLQPLDENDDFSKISVSDYTPANNLYDNLKPENFDSRTVEEPYIENNIKSTNLMDTVTEYESVGNNEIHDEEIVNDAESTISDTETVIENMSVLKDTASVETNLNNFSFFEDAANF